MEEEVVDCAELRERAKDIIDRYYASEDRDEIDLLEGELNALSELGICGYCGEAGWYIEEEADING